MTSPFDATPAMLGYLYQVRVALLDALERLRYQGSFTVEIETLDDVSFESEGRPLELFQAKHHITKVGGLGDMSVDLWKSIRVWTEGLRNGRWASDTVYYLVTTGEAQSGAAAAYLRNDDARNADSARTLLDSAARTSDNDANRLAYGEYLSLGDEERLALLQRVVIADRAPDIAEVGERLQHELAHTVEREFVGQLVTRLEGWWFTRVIAHLRREGVPAIRSEEVEAELSHLRAQFRSDNLPIDRDLLEAAIDEDAFQSHMFVEQLRLIDLTNKRILTAMRNYFRASEQRSRWLREGFLLFGELERYDARLCEEWETRFDAMTQELGSDLTEQKLRREARAFYAWVEQDASYPIRAACSELFVTRGSFHTLADELRVGWHPKFPERLAPLLGDADD